MLEQLHLTWMSVTLNKIRSVTNLNVLKAKVSITLIVEKVIKFSPLRWFKTLSPSKENKLYFIQFIISVTLFFFFLSSIYLSFLHFYKEFITKFLIMRSTQF